VRKVIGISSERTSIRTFASTFFFNTSYGSFAPRARVDVPLAAPTPHTPMRDLARGVALARALARSKRAIASTSGRMLNEDDRDGGKTIEIIEANLVRETARGIFTRLTDARARV